MRISLGIITILLGLAIACVADQPTIPALQTWDFANLDDVKLTASKGSIASMGLSPDIRTPEGKNVLKIDLKEFGPDAVPWDIQLRFIYAGGLKSGCSYEVSFPCKGSTSGTVQTVAAQAGSPWEALPGSSTNFDIGPEWKTVKLSFTAQKDWEGPLAISRFMLAKYGAAATLYLGPVVFREVPKALPFSLNKEWRLFLGVDGPVEFGSVPIELKGPKGVVKAQSIILKEGALNLASLAGAFQEKDCAVLYNEFDSIEAGRMRIGVSADWWLELYVNGEKVYGTVPGGNGSHDFVPDDHVLDIPVKAGHNILAAKVLGGQSGWRFVCGEATRAPDSGDLFVARPGAAWKAIDMDKLIVKAGTALDFSALTGERRVAGQLGRLTVNGDGRLAFEKEPGKPVRFLAFNCWLSNWRVAVHTWTKKEIEDFAASVARQGYTMVRFQSVDRFLLGYKIHTPPLGSFKERGIPQKAEDIEFDAGNLDRLDYLIACLKKNGVYVNLDIMTAETGYSMAHPSLTPPESSFRVRLFFDPEYRKHWEAAVGYLLNHRNPYTELCLKDDPAIANFEPYNEQDLLLYEKGMMKDFTPFFRRYLQEKYSTNEAFAKAWGQAGLTFDTVPDINEEMIRKGDARAEDAGRFFIKIMTDMTVWYYGVLRGNGYNGLITEWDMIMRTMEIPVRAQMPVIAQHAYFSHPSFNKVLTKNLVKKSSNWRFSVGDPKFDVLYSQGSSLNSSFFRASAVARFLDRPFVVTEYSHSAVNRYRHERGLFFGSYAALQGWDGLTEHGTVAAVKTTTLDPFSSFENAVDPIARASDTVAALAWFRGDVKEAPHSIQLDLSDKALFPKNFLAAIGDDYAKLGMLTKIGIVYPEIKPLGPIGRTKPDIELTPGEFSPLSVSQWYASASSGDGSSFSSLLQKLRDGNILPDSNKTDYVRRLFQSETGEISLNSKDETMTVVSPRLEGALLKKDQPTPLGSMEIESCSKPASVVLASLDREKSIADSKRLLLVFATNALNNGMTFENSSMSLMVEVGGFPVLMEAAKLSLHLNGSQGGKPVVYALNLDGTRAEPIECEFKSARLYLQIDTAKLQYATPFFEIVYP